MIKKVLMGLGLGAVLAFGNVDTGTKLGECLVAHTTPQDKLLLVKWIVGSYAHHPALKGMVKVDEVAFHHTEEGVAHLFERLLTKDCKTQFEEAVKEKGPQAVQEGFAYLGKMAGLEVSTNPVVQQTLQHFVGYLTPQFTQKMVSLH